jgi:hypothetical protein
VLTLQNVDNFRDEVDRAVNKYGKNRIGVFIGTSTSGIEKVLKFISG